MKGIGIQKSNILIIIGILSFLISIASSQDYSNTFRKRYVPNSGYTPSDGEMTFTFSVDPGYTIVNPTPTHSEVKRADGKFKRGKIESDQTCSHCFQQQSTTTFTVQTAITHKICSELSLYLTSPSGITSTLVDKNGGSFSNLYNGTLFIDSAQYTAATYPLTKNGMVSPLQPLTSLSSFGGGLHFGDWSFKLKDSVYNGIFGTLYWIEVVIQGLFPHFNFHFISFFFLKKILSFSNY